MRWTLILLGALTFACGSGGARPPAPTLAFLTPSTDTLRTIGPSGALLRIVYQDDASVSGATTSLY